MLTSKNCTTSGFPGTITHISCEMRWLTSFAHYCNIWSCTWHSVPLLTIRAHGHPLGHVQVQFSDRRDRLITRGPESPWGRWEGIAFQTCGSETPRGPEGLIQEKMRSSFNSWWFNLLEMISVRERIMRTNSDNGFHSALPTLSAHMERSDEERIAESRNEPLKIDSEPPSAWTAEAQT